MELNCSKLEFFGFFTISIKFLIERAPLIRNLGLWPDWKEASLMQVFKNLMLKTILALRPFKRVEFELQEPDSYLKSCIGAKARFSDHTIDS
jgi:hypothetical protein